MECAQKAFIYASPRAQKAKRRTISKKKRRKQVPTNIPVHIPTFKPQAFHILPETIFHPRIHHLLSFCTSSIQQQGKFLCSYATNPYYTLFSEDLTGFWSPTISKELAKAFVLLRKVRRLFRVLLHVWRVKHLNQANTEDIVTGEIPRHPVSIVDWNSKSIYVFEASTLARDIMERLLCHDGLWKDVQPPRNLFTNIPLTHAQLISIYQQLSRVPIQLSWALGAFRQVRYDLMRFEIEYATPLLLHAYRKTMRDVTHEDYKERMMDFITYAYDQEDIDCLSVTYSYCLEQFPNTPILKQWSSLCFKFYEAPIVYYKHPEAVQLIQNAILQRSKPLLGKQVHLKTMRLAHLKIVRDISQNQNVSPS